MSKHIIEEVRELESIILSNLSNLFDEFERRTGFYPESVDVTIHKVQAFGHPDRNMLTETKVRLGI